MPKEPEDIEQIICRVEERSCESERVSFGDVLEASGSRSFGPLLLLAGLIISLPLVGDIPGVPTAIGIVVIIISVQLLVHRKHFWLPQWMLKRSVDTEKLRKALQWVKKPAQWLDRMLRPRLEKLVEGVWVHVIALVSCALALLTPAMEVVPFSANGAGAVLTVFGLAIISRDGLMVLIGLVLLAISVGIATYFLVTG